MTTEPPRLNNVDPTTSNTDRNLNLARHEDHRLQRQKKPSYVGLSCSVSGYSQYIRYTSPSRKSSPPQQFRVSTEPQILDCNDYNYNMKTTQQDHVVPVRGQQSKDTPDLASFYPASHTRKIIQSGGMTTVETVTKFYNNNNNLNNMRETSPGGGSDTSSVGSGGSLSSGTGGTLVQKQIERLYGGKMSTVRLTSPEPKLDESSSSCSPESETTLFQHNNSKNGSPLELKQLKVPAVFRLLRPEFREQLKSNSCQVKIPTDLSATPKSRHERIIPISVEKTSASNNGNHEQEEQRNSVERIIPVVKDDKPYQGRKTDVTPEKPALPAKPMSPTRSPRSPASPSLPSSPPSTTTNEITSPALVSSLQKAASAAATNGCNGAKENTENTTVEEETSFPQPEDLEEEELMDEYPCAGVRERTLLCPIQEEDTESTASGSSVSVATKRSSSSSVINNNINNNPTASTNEDNKVIQEEVHDGHYFIKILENEIFKFEEQICDFEEDLSNEANDIPEDVRDSILAAIGKAKLLMSQKLAQFRGLCDKNIHSNPEEDPFVPTSEDLAGFWDMVYIQIEHINSLFAELTTIRQNGWKKPQQPEKKVEKKEPVKTNKAKSKVNGKSAGGPKSEAAKARDEARRKMLEEKKRQMKLKQQQASEEKKDNECIFVEF